MGSAIERDREVMREYEREVERAYWDFREESAAVAQRHRARLDAARRKMREARGLPVDE